MRVSGIGLRETEILARGCKHVSCEGCCLVRVDVGGVIPVIKRILPFMQSTKFQGFSKA